MKEAIFNKLAEITECDDLNMDTQLKSLDLWDSLSTISFLVYAKSKLGVQFENVEVINKAETVSDLIDLTIERMNKS